MYRPGVGVGKQFDDSSLLSLKEYHLIFNMNQLTFFFPKKINPEDLKESLPRRETLQLNPAGVAPARQFRLWGWGLTVSLHT